MFHCALQLKDTLASFYNHLISVVAMNAGILFLRKNIAIAQMIGTGGGIADIFLPSEAKDKVSVRGLKYGQASGCRPGRRAGSRGRINDSSSSISFSKVTPLLIANDSHGLFYDSVDCRRGATGDSAIPMVKQKIRLAPSQSTSRILRPCSIDHKTQTRHTRHRHMRRFLEAMKCHWLPP